MDEYISKKDILQMIESTAMWNRSFSILYEDIEDMKPADVAPVVHGRWVNTHSDSEFVQCSLCKYPVYAAWNVTNYCPNCGAKMKGDG